MSKILCRQNGNLCFPLVDQCSNMFASYFMGLKKNLSRFKRSNMFVKYLKGWNISLHSWKIISCKKSINCLQWPNLKETLMIRHVVSFTNVNFQFPLVIRVFFLSVVRMYINAIAYQTFNNIKHLEMVKLLMQVWVECWCECLLNLEWKNASKIYNDSCKVDF